MNNHSEENENQSKCPDDNTLGTYLDDELSDEERRFIEFHIQGCQRCRAVINFFGKTKQENIERTLSKTFDETLDPLSKKIFPFSQLSIGKTIGRYIIVKPLGLGGMGEVYLAYDPELNRRVALKLLRTDIYADSNIKESASRLMKEAQAMALLSHPNVISIHDVLKVDGQVVIAMEYFSDGTLKSWLRKQPRGWREIVEVFFAAGQGLAAAHTAKLVHRDFKPSNVLVDKDGRICVTDFGLVRGLDTEENPEPPRSIPVSSRLDESVTKTGAFVGTPAYMSPEQLQGEKSDTRSDQFCFCVALFEALYGQRPYQGETPEELRESILSGKIASVDLSKYVPAWLHDIVKRGLEVKPEDRHASMDALLAELKHDPEQEEKQRRALRSRRLAWISVVLLAVVLPVGVWYGMRYRTVQSCKDTTREFSGVWDNPTKEVVKKAFLAIGKPYALGTWFRVESIFDKYLAEWTQMRSDVCEAKHVHGTESEELFDLRMSCLKKRKQELNALSKVFSKADAKVVEKAIEASSSITGIDICADEKDLRALYPPPKSNEQKTQVASIREKLVEVQALEKTGKYKQALELVKAINEEANKLGYSPLQAESLYWFGELLERVGEYKKAETTLNRASKVAGECGYGLVAAKATTGLAFVVGTHQARHEQGLLMGQHAKVLLGIVGEAGVLRAHLLKVTGTIFAAKGDYAKAQEYFRKSIVIAEKALGHEHPNIARILSNLGNVSMMQGKYKEAIQSFRKALMIWEKTLGPEHPQVASALNGLGIVFSVQGEYDKTLEKYQQALAIQEKALGSEHPNLATTLNNLANVYRKLLKFDKAIDNISKALAIREKALGPRHPDVASSLSSMAIAFTEQGYFEKALEYYRRALAIQERAQGPEHPEVAELHNNMGFVFDKQGHYDKALDSFRRAMAIFEKTLGPVHMNVAIILGNIGDILKARGKQNKALENYRRAVAIIEKTLGSAHPVLAYSLGGMGEIFFTQGKLKNAIASLERLLAICEKKNCDSEAYGNGLFTLAQALLASGGDKQRAIGLARQAKNIFNATPQAFKKERKKADDWLEKHEKRIQR